MLTDPNAALTSVVLTASFVRFKASMAAFSEGRISHCPFGCCDLVAMVETQGGYEKATRRVAGYEEEFES